MTKTGLRAATAVGDHHQAGVRPVLEGPLGRLRHHHAPRLHHAYRDAGEVQRQVRPSLAPAQPIAQRHRFSDREVVGQWVIPVDQLDRLGRLAGSDLHRRALAQQAVDRLVVPVQAAVEVDHFGAQQEEGAVDLVGRMARVARPGGAQVFPDAVAAWPAFDLLRRILK